MIPNLRPVLCYGIYVGHFFHLHPNIPYDIPHDVHLFRIFLPVWHNGLCRYERGQHFSKSVSSSRQELSSWQSASSHTNRSFRFSFEEVEQEPWGCLEKTVPKIFRRKTCFQVCIHLQSLLILGRIDGFYSMSLQHCTEKWFPSFVNLDSGELSLCPCAQICLTNKVVFRPEPKRSFCCKRQSIKVFFLLIFTFAESK